MANKKLTDKLVYLWAFIFGMVLMLIVYALFQTTAKRARARSAESGDLQTDETYARATYTSIVQTSGMEEEPLSPSAYLGVEIVSVDSVIAEQLGISGKNGVLINSVVPDSPAQKAGLLRGDVIIALNNRTIKDVGRLREVMARLSPADRVRVVFIRNGKKDLTYAELAEAPAIVKTAQTTDSDDSGWGVSLSPLSSTVRESLGIPPDVNGVVILSVVPGGAADQAGLMAGDVIRGIDRTPISDMDDFFRALSSDRDDTALLDVNSRGDMRYVPMDSSGIKVADRTQSQTTLRQKIFSMFTGGTPFATDEDEDEGPKGGKFAQDDLQLTADNTAFNRPSSVPGDVNTGGSGPTGVTGMNRPSEVPPQLGGPANDLVLFVGLLLIVIVYLAYREFHRPPERDK